jgi:hypothetical protein
MPLMRRTTMGEIHSNPGCTKSHLGAEYAEKLGLERYVLHGSPDPESTKFGNFVSTILRKEKESNDE